MRRRFAAAAVFLTLLSCVAFGIHYYLARRLVLDLELAPGLEKTLLGALVLLAATLVATPILQRRLSPRWTRLVVWPAGLWLGTAFLLLVTLAASDVALLLAGAAAGASAADVATGRALGALAVAGVAAGVAMRSGLRPPGVRRIEIPLARWPRALDGYRIVQISDIHIGAILRRKFAADLVQRVNALAPDLVAVTGDLVDGSVRRLGAEVEPFGGLCARHGVFFVTGNHDYYSGAESWVARVRGLGMRPLRNEHLTLGEGEAAFDLAGVEDHHAHFVAANREDVPGALDGRDPARPVVLLAHDPAAFPEASRLGVDLQLSGHTHGGQIWPFHYLVRLSVPFVAGLYTRGGSKLYVSRGTGFWGPPMRLFAPAEITEITLRAA